jgi:hypothetical protein
VLQAAPLAILAGLAHPIPFVWFVGITAYQAIARRLPARLQAGLFVAGLAALFLIRRYILAHSVNHWRIKQLILVLGVDQTIIFGKTYLIAALPFLVFLAILYGSLRHRWRDLSAISCQLYGLTAATIAIVPTTIQATPTSAGTGLIAERMSLLAALLLLAGVCHVRGRVWQLVGGVVVASAFFGLLYRDLDRAGRMEAKMEALVRTLPPGERFAAYVSTLDGRELNGPDAVPRGWSAKLDSFLGAHSVNLPHMLSRACIGRCFDYQNYEPATGSFRIRVNPGSPVVMSDIGAVYGMESGYYVLKDSDPPIHLIYRCGRSPDDLCLRTLLPGQSVRSVLWPATASPGNRVQ